MRSGLLAEKLGMTHFFDESGNTVPVTVLRIEGCQVVAQRRQESDGYFALQLGFGFVKLKNVTRPVQGHFAKANLDPKRHLVEFRVSPENLIDVGAQFQADHFAVGQCVDATSVSIGKGFAGPVKAHNFGGNRASHGNSKTTRSHGSTGACQDPGRVFKGKKMAKRLGGVRVTLQNLKVVRVDVERHLVFVRGSVPGAKGALVLLRDSVKLCRSELAPLPGSYFLPERPVSDSDSGGTGGAPELGGDPSVNSDSRAASEVASGSVVS